MSEEFDYMDRTPTQQQEEVWCKINPQGQLEHFDWNFVEKIAKEFDQIPEGGPKNNAQVICKLAVLIREQTIKQCAEVIQKYATQSALSNVVVLKDPLGDEANEG